mgnify:CR=1 FL=1
MTDFPPAESGLVATETSGDNAAPFSVSELAMRLKRTVEDAFGFVRVRGEISGWKRAASGHLYCCLKDEGAVIDGVMWRTAAQRPTGKRGTRMGGAELLAQAGPSNRRNKR